MASPKQPYSAEIASMVYVFSGIRDPDEALVEYLGDVVKMHISELVIQARAQATRRGSRFLSVEDLIFLVRHDRAKVNRLRSYLSWKDVRKKRVMEPEADEDIDGMEEPVSDKALKVLKTTVRLPWEFNDLWADYLHGEDEPEDEAEAYEVNKQRLKEAEEITRNMTKEEYEQYAQARQASFVYRKAKKFRDFLSLSTLLDALSPADEVLDVLGFLSYECVRALCDAGATNKKSGEEARRKVREAEKRRAEVEEEREDGREGKRRRIEAGDEGVSPSKDTPMLPEKDAGGLSPSKVMATRKSGEAVSASQAAASASTAAANRLSPQNKPLEIPISLFSAPLVEPPTTTPSLPSVATMGGEAASGAAGGAGGMQPVLLQLEDVAQGYQAVQHAQASLKTNGMRNWRGGLTRLSNRLV
ncbi:hypothetical protein JCM8547_007750 [Rhodosporidiobolus lusitaniae]